MSVLALRSTLCALRSALYALRSTLCALRSGLAFLAPLNETLGNFIEIVFFTLKDMHI
jgi:hypothetical protein